MFYRTFLAFLDYTEHFQGDVTGGVTWSVLVQLCGEGRARGYVPPWSTIKTPSAVLPSNLESHPKQ